MESNGLDERYREINNINEKLEKYPKDKASWFKEKQKVIDKSTAIQGYFDKDSVLHIEFDNSIQFSGHNLFDTR